MSGHPEANAEERLAKIIQAHQTDKNADGHGGISGYCVECEVKWPCPTYRNAAESGVTWFCSWDLDKCAFEEHDHDQL